MTRSKLLALGVGLLGSACFGVALGGCGSSGSPKTAIGQNAPSQVEDRVASEVHKASACTKVVRSFSALAENLGVSGSSVATISSTKESLHELAETSANAQKYTITRLTQVLSKLETVTNKALEDNYSGTHRELPILGAESKELIGKVLVICGKKEVSKSTGGESGSGSAVSSSPPTTTEASGPPNCREAAVQTASTCELEGTTVVVAHRHGGLRLKTLAARIEAIRTTSSFSSGIGTTAAHGIFLVISLHVTNMASTPQVFDGVGEKQVALSVSKHYYGESFEAENERDKQSFITNGEPIQPGESETGDLVFDVPPSVAGEVQTLPESGLFVGNFGDNEIESTPSGTGLITAKGVTITQTGSTGSTASDQHTTTTSTLGESSHNEQNATVPDETQVRLDVAEEELESRKLAYKVVGGGLFGVVVKSHWTVCEMKPSPGTHIGSGTTVRLIVARSCE